ncbi:MAG: hypothetical protein JXA77_14440 [Bacteroidales bacterium]|nr:hypothetical protein [Bacteroidales bacterium]MBN2821198.1 hypothetical protein [Bacteroidales bacterium]
MQQLEGGGVSGFWLFNIDSNYYMDSHACEFANETKIDLHISQYSENMKMDDEYLYVKGMPADSVTLIWPTSSSSCYHYNLTRPKDYTASDYRDKWTGTYNGVISRYMSTSGDISLSYDSNISVDVEKLTCSPSQIRLSEGFIKDLSGLDLKIFDLANDLTFGYRKFPFIDNPQIDGSFIDDSVLIVSNTIWGGEGVYTYTETRTE